MVVWMITRRPLNVYGRLNCSSCASIERFCFVISIEKSNMREVHGVEDTRGF